MWIKTKTIARRTQENECICGSKSNLDCNCFCRDEIVSGARLAVGKKSFGSLATVVLYGIPEENKRKCFSFLATVPANVQGIRKKTG